LRNQEAERYARIAVLAAGLVVLIVIGVYFQRSVRRRHARRASSSAVPSEVQQQSDNFSYSDVEQGRTIFTVRASHATQYKDQNRALLQDVWITVYGHEGNRNDNIHTRECSYEPLSGGIRCQGAVQIDMQAANPSPRAAGTPGAPGAGQSAGQATDQATLQAMHVKTSDITFNRETGEAATSAPVEFQFPQGQGRGVGVSYSTRNATVRVNQSVEFNLNASDRAGGLPVDATGSSLEIHRNEHRVILAGPSTVRQGDRQLSAGKITIILDESDHAKEAIAGGSPVLHGASTGGKFSLAASRFQAALSQQGWVESIAAEGSVNGERHSAAGTDHFSAAQVNFTMLPERNLIREMTASGGVTAESKQGAESRSLKTETLRISFANRPAPASRSNGQQSQNASQAPAQTPESQRIESAETLAPATIESKSASEAVTLSAKKFVAQFDSAGRLDKLLGHADVEIRRQVPGSAPQASSSAELAATFAPDGQWDSLDQSGNVRFREADRAASAARARMSRATGITTLEGSPVLSDATSRTTASAVTMNQQSGELRASGKVVSTYLASASNDAINLGSGPAHISADALSGSAKSGHVVYEGHARLWQGESVLEAQRIEIWRDDKKLEATGHVVAIFPQAPGSGPTFAIPSSRPPAAAAAAFPSPAVPEGPTLWQIHAPVLTYWANDVKAHLEGNVTATSEQGSLESKTLDVFFTPATTPSPGTGASRPSAQSPGSGSGANAGQQLSQVLAQGNVVVRQGDRRGTGEQAEYTAASQKFVLSGGQPTLTDAASDTTTGRSLTFFVASDTILIDSQDGVRTLTKHRVEK
jgi:lipopolysaccharide export system protein LptA